MTPDQLKARQLAGAAGAGAAQSAGKISSAMKALYAQQAAEREAMEIDHHNAKLELREKHIAAAQALAAKEKPPAPKK